MRVSALDALRRGVLSLRANPMLVLLQMGQGVVVTILGIAGMVPLVLALGVGAAREMWRMSQQGWSPAQSGQIEAMVERSLEQWPMLLAALAAGGAVWTVAFLVYCWVQAGVLGRLAAAQERAGDSSEASALAVYSWASFVRDAGARTWKFFWLLNLLIVVGMALLSVVILGASLILTLSGQSGGLGLALAVGCVLLLVSFVVFLVLFAWTGLAKAEMVVADSGVMATFRRSLRLLARRLGAVLFLVFLFIVVSIGMGLVFLPVSLALDFAMGDSISRQIVADVVMMLVQTPISAALTAALSASMVALVRGER